MKTKQLGAHLVPVLGLKPETLYVPSKHILTEQYPQPCNLPIQRGVSQVSKQLLCSPLCPFSVSLSLERSKTIGSSGQGEWGWENKSGKMGTLLMKQACWGWAMMEGLCLMCIVYNV